MLRLAYFVELTWLLVDTASGYFQNNGIMFPGNQTLGSLFRIFVFLLFALIIIKNPKGSRMLPIYIFPLLIILAMLRAIYWNFEFIQIINDVQFQVKILFSIILFNIFKIQLMNGVLTFQKINNIIIINAVVLLTNLLLGLFGVGFGNYGVGKVNDDTLGSKGFLYAGNEASITLVALLGLFIFLNRNFLKKHIYCFVVTLLVFFVASISSLSKTSILGFILVTFYSIYNYLIFRDKIKIIIIFALFLLATSVLWFPMLDIAIERWQFFYEVSPDFWSFITSKRSERVEDLFAWISDDVSIFSVFIGQGHLGDDSKFSFENDLLDLIVKAGLSGVFIYSIWFVLVWNTIKGYLISRSEDAKFSIYMLVIILLISIVAGHVMYSVMLAPFFAFIAIISTGKYPHKN